MADSQSQTSLLEQQTPRRYTRHTKKELFSPSVRVKRSASIVQSVESHKRQRMHTTSQAITPDSDDELSRDSPARFPTSDDHTFQTSRTPAKSMPVSAPRPAEDHAANDHTDFITTFPGISKYLPQLEDDLERLNNLLVAQSTKLDASIVVRDALQKDFDSARDQLERYQKEHGTLQAFLTHSEGFANGQSSNIILGMIAEGRDKLAQVGDQVRAKRALMETAAERLDDSDESAKALQSRMDDMAQASFLITKKLRDPLEKLEKSIVKWGYVIDEQKCMTMDET